MSKQHRTVQQDEDDLDNLSPLEAAKERQAHAEAAAAEAQAFYQFFARHKELDASEANTHVMKHFIGEGVFIDVALLESALAVMKDGDPRSFPLSRRTPGQNESEREEVVSAILDLKGGDDAYIKNERAKLNLKNPTNKQYVHGLDELKSILEELELRQRLSKLSVAELKQLVKPPAPPEVVLDAKFSAAILKAMAPNQLRSLISCFGIDAINARLSGKN